MFHFFKKKSTEELVVPPQPLPQRNDLCWCGSEEKYKKCHSEQDQKTLLLIKEKEQAQKKRRSMFS